MVGPHVASGGSENEEAQARTLHSEVDDRIHDLGGVTEAEKSWLLANAILVLYPSLYEGFGLIPFEAVFHHTPVLAFRDTAVGEVLGDEVTYLTSYNPERGAEVVWHLINDREASRRQIELIQARAQLFTWNNVAYSVWELYDRVLRLPPRRVGNYHSQPTTKTTVKVTARNWGQRLLRGLRILRTHGWKAFRKEIRQYIQWRRAQF
jgi:glycogen synthase